MIIKASFEVQPVLTPHPKNPKKWMVFDHDWCFVVNGIPYCVPKGYWYDGASVPPPAWMIVGPPCEPDFWAPAGAHDPLYLAHVLPRSTADEVLFQFLIRNKVPLWKARTMWSAVRAGAFWAWTNNKADKQCLDEVRKMVYARPDSPKFDTLWKAAA